MCWVKFNSKFKNGYIFLFIISKRTGHLSQHEFYTKFKQSNILIHFLILFYFIILCFQINKQNEKMQAFILLKLIKIKT